MDPMKLSSLEMGRTYEMWVVSVIENRKPFNSGNTVKYVHDITLKDEFDNYYKPEYVSLSPKLENKFTVGQKSIFTCVRSTNSGHNCDEIEPTPGRTLPNIPASVIPNFTLVAGHSYSQAIALATQIKCAETTLGIEFFEADLFALADKIDSWILNKKEFHNS